MQSVAIALFLGAALFVLLQDPLAGVSIGLLALLGHRRLTALERRTATLEAAVEEGAAVRAATGVRAETRARSAVATSRTPAVSPDAAAQRAPRTSAEVEPAAALPRGGAGPSEPPAWLMRIREAWARGRSASFAELEELLAGRLLAVVGGIALIIGALFFLGLAFTRGWIGPELRVVIGLVAGVALFALGGWLLRGPRQIVAHVLAAVGLAVFSLAFFAATRLYGFVAPELGVGAALVAAAAAAALSVRYDAPIVAVFGLVAVLASPPIMGASAGLLTLGFVGAALAGTTAIAVFRSWRWLPVVAFGLAAPQLASYVFGDPPVGIALGAVGAFWVLNAVAAGGEELHRRQFRLSPSSAGLLVLAAAFTVAAGFEALSGRLEQWRGLFLLAVALAHLALAAVFLLRETDRHPFGMLAAGTGIAAITMAVPIQLGAAWVPLAWSAEAVALAWIYVERRHVFSGLAAAVLGVMAAGHILAVEYPPELLPRAGTDGVPFVNPNGMALGFVILAAVVGIWVLRIRHERMALAAVAGVLLAVAIPHELRGWAAAAALTTLVAGTVIAERRLLGVPLRFSEDDGPWADISWRLDAVGAIGDRALYATAAIAAVFLSATFFAALPPETFVDRLADPSLPVRAPFLNEPSAIALVVATGAIVAGVVCGGAWRPAGILAGVAVTAYLLPFQLPAAIVVAGWAALAAGLAAGAVRISPSLANGARLLAGAAALETLAVVAPVDRLWVRATAPDELAVLNGGLLAVVATAVMLTARAYLPPDHPERRWAGYAAAGVAVYAASIALVDVFQTQVGGSIAVEELQKQAQVALSVLWGVIGSVTLVLGLRVARAPLRLAGLGLLGIVTLKVFVIDLAALDIAYRVLSFAALGVLLLAAAYLYGRMQPHQAPGRHAIHH